ncbi:STAS/SEC14 domain-containing protein [Pontibacter sp. JH31]|uniref:STAS/SEC14 domain-containing protein n=1 Tax=Pontibacter aquaedesilientis TaxID=2766980 RepID=A0ABR7XJA4_9BACT|nr:STAS/SEC14 domain-containing protein [Pontibacter aquaedesilientis]MBD1398361.1 STAS/SEC14 domain-containing protein [Pontibacter aquaedesilientis]
MLQLLEESKEDLVALRLTGSIDKYDYQVMLPILEEKIKQYGKVRVYAELQEVEDLSLRALWEDLKFDFRHAADFNRVAIVGNRKWLDWLTVMASPFTTAKVKYFEHIDRDKALHWIKADNEQ